MLSSTRPSVYTRPLPQAAYALHPREELLWLEHTSPVGLRYSLHTIAFTDVRPSFLLPQHTTPISSISYFPPSHINQRPLPSLTHPPSIYVGDDSFPHASEFIPERWYSRPDLIKDRSAFMPFGVGKCPFSLSSCLLHFPTSHHYTKPATQPTNQPTNQPTPL